MVFIYNLHHCTYSKSLQLFGPFGLKSTSNILATYTIYKIISKCEQEEIEKFLLNAQTLHTSL